MNSKIRQDLFIRKIYEHTDGSIKMVTEFCELARSWGFSDDEIANYAHYFEDRDYLHIIRHKDDPIATIRLTVYGVGYVERLDVGSLL